MSRQDDRKNIVNYFKKNLKKGYTLDALRIALLNQGYLKVLIERAVEQATSELSKAAPVLKEKPVIKYEIIDEYDNPVTIKKSWWKRVFG
ncbi:hypothetical protein GOV13_01570 [Candidatus Pacearchaeota archaeon]|nr:hypothetical protein [Candidatus Pacearchaeota archaeon]